MASQSNLRNVAGAACRRRAALIACLLAAALGGCKADLYTKLQEREANEMVALLLGNGFDAGRTQSKDGTSTVVVEQKQFAQAVELLKANGYPHQTFTNMGEVFKGGGLIASPTEERARYVYALSEELSKTISDIDGVLSARIHVVLPKNDLLRQDATPSSASVFIRYDARAPVKALLQQIKMLVANSIEGLSYEKVSVVLVPVERNEVQPVITTAATGTAPMTETVQWPIAMFGGLLIGAGGVYWFSRRRTAAAQQGPAQVQPVHAMVDRLPPGTFQTGAAQPKLSRGTPRQAA
ncbi:type III secretion system inner membrane ring lipoprotein SctJ [Bradyrhizobium cenepequi]|uniref:type III secretion system inner membrane ring lipoprotein SctJ n=1 Tax=Bradyrhizobium cenepequi TaxID=2821403 RepID=UPI0024C0135D|nr:type III secretion inner membrane ring lipoprotein SctJ [Bradyrhizobium cenepequi]MCA6105789.1 type III secretion inner membrane ring lipoprotein SctJ [Bradyrhizobium cenepequi]